MGSPMIVVQTYRSFEEQEALYAKGRWRPGPKVTNARAGDSFHNYRMAFDVCFLLPDGRLTWNGPWEQVGLAGEELGLTWGGRFHNFPDRPHFQYSDGLSLAQLKIRNHVQEILNI